MRPFPSALVPREACLASDAPEPAGEREGDEGAAEEPWPLGPCQGCCCSLGSRFQLPPPPHPPSIVDQQPRSDAETEEFQFGWDPDEGPFCQ